MYGTLLDMDNEYAIYLKNNSEYYTSGKIRAELYDIGEYPGAVLSSQSKTGVKGRVLKINNPAEVLTVIDGYEGFGENQPQPNEFIRTEIGVETEVGKVVCWVYLYNLPVAGLKQIESRGI